MASNERVINVRLEESTEFGRLTKYLDAGSAKLGIEITGDPLKQITDKLGTKIPVNVELKFDNTSIASEIGNIERLFEGMVGNINSHLKNIGQGLGSSAFESIGKNIGALGAGMASASSDASSLAAATNKAAASTRDLAAERARFESLTVNTVKGDAKTFNDNLAKAQIAGVNTSRIPGGQPVDSISRTAALAVETRLTNAENAERSRANKPAPASRGISSPDPAAVAESNRIRTEAAESLRVARENRSAERLRRPFGGSLTQAEAEQLEKRGIPSALVGKAQTLPPTINEITKSVVIENAEKERIQKEAADRIKQDIVDKEKERKQAQARQEADDKRESDRLDREARQFRARHGSIPSPEGEAGFLAAGGRQEVIDRAKSQDFTTTEVLRATKPGSSSNPFAVIEKQAQKLEKAFENPSIGEFISGTFGGQRGRDSVRAERARQLQIANPQIANLEERLLSTKQGSFFRPQNLKDTGTLSQVGFAAVFGGLPGAAVATAAAVTPFGKSGALLASTVQQGVGALVDPIISAFKDREDAFKEAGIAFSRSILGISSVLQSTTQVVGAGGQVANVGSAIRFQEKQAESIQLAARAKLLPLGIAGATESTFVQGIVSALGQRGISAGSGQIATIAERLGGVIRASRPQLLENPALLNRDLQDVLSGLPQANRTILGSLLRSSLPGLGSAKNGDDIVKALDKIAPFAETVKNSNLAPAVLDRLSGQQELLNTKGGEAFFDVLKPGVKNLTDVLKTDDVQQAVATLGTTMGTLAKFSIDLTSNFTKLGAGILNSVAPLGKLIGEFGPFGTAILGAAASVVAAQKIGQIAFNSQKTSAAVASIGGSVLAAGSTSFLAGGGLSSAGLGVIKPGPVIPSFIGKSLAGIGGLLGKFGPAAFASALGIDLLSQIPNQLDEQAAGRIDRTTDIQSETVDRLQASRSVTSNRGQISANLNAAGINEDILKARAERNQSAGNKLNTLNFTASSFGNTKEFSDIAPELFEAQAKSIGDDFTERTKSFSGIEGEIIVQEKTRKELIVKRAEAEKNSLEALIKRNKEENSGADTPQKRLGDIDKNLRIAKAQREIALDQVKNGKFAKNDSLTFNVPFLGATDFAGPAKRFGEAANEANLSAISGGKFLTDTEISTHNNLLDQALVDASVKVKSLETSRVSTAGEVSTGDRKLTSDFQAEIEKSRESTQTRNLGIDSLKKEASLYAQLADNTKGAFVRGSVGGTQDELEKRLGFQSTAIEKTKAAIPLLEEQISDIATKKANFELTAATDKDPGRRDLAQKRVNDLADEQKAAEFQLANAPQEVNKRLLENAATALSLRESKLGTTSLEERQVGINRETFGGTLLTNQLGANEDRLKIQAREQQIAANNANSDFDEKTRNALNESLRVEQSGFGVNAVQKDQLAQQSVLARQSGQAQLGNAQLDISNLVADEAARRRELNDQIVQSTAALANFDNAIVSKTTSEELSIANLAKKVKGEGGDIPLGLDLSDERLKSLQLASDRSLLNEKIANIGFNGTASGGQGLGIVNQTSPFATGLEAERHKLEDNVLKSGEAVAKLTFDFAALDAALQSTISKLNSQLGVAEPGKAAGGTPAAPSTASLPPGKSPGLGGGGGSGGASGSGATGGTDADPSGAKALPKIVVPGDPRFDALKNPSATPGGNDVVPLFDFKDPLGKQLTDYRGGNYPGSPKGSATDIGNGFSDLAQTALRGSAGGLFDGSFLDGQIGTPGVNLPDIRTPSANQVSQNKNHSASGGDASNAADIKGLSEQVRNLASAVQELKSGKIIATLDPSAAAIIGGAAGLALKNLDV